MRLHVVSDVHGAVEDLARAADGADVFICLGDLILFLDYDDPGQGIFADLFGAADARRFVELRTANRFGEAHEFSAGLWARIQGDRREVMSEHVDRQYARLFEAMPAGYLTYGNVDVPALWPRHVRDHHVVLDGQVIEIGGLRFGFVGGGLVSAMRTPYEISDDDFGAKVAALGTVDVLCSHIPPAVPELTYDVVARRFETGSSALLTAIRETQPRLVLHGHVHQPLVPRMRIGRTECINVGHFRARRRPYVLQW